MKVSLECQGVEFIDCTWHFLNPEATMADPSVTHGIKLLQAMPSRIFSHKPDAANSLVIIQDDQHGYMEMQIYLASILPFIQIYAKRLDFELLLNMDVDRMQVTLCQVHIQGKNRDWA